MISFDLKKIKIKDSVWIALAFVIYAALALGRYYGVFSNDMCKIVATLNPNPFMQLLHMSGLVDFVTDCSWMFR